MRASGKPADGQRSGCRIERSKVKIVPTPTLVLSAIPASGAELRRHVFVYGTLRKGEIRDINLLRPAPIWVGQGSVNGELYDLAAYPGIVLPAADARSAEAHEGLLGEVYGEIYAITPELEQLLDEIEEVWPQQTGEYTKREVPVRLVGQPGALKRDESSKAAEGVDDIGGPSVTCLVYEIALQRTAGKPKIDGGDWVTHRLKV